MVEQNSFDPSYFEHIKIVEDKYFWFNVRKKWIFDKITKFVNPPAQILDAGCGTGNVSSFLAEKGFNVTGCDYYEEAFNISWPGFKKVRGDVSNLPFKNNSFDVVGLFDVIEHLENDIKPLKEAARVINKDGIVAVTVPAKEELWSQIDESSFHKRRYSKKYLDQILYESGLKPLLIEYMFMSLYLPMKSMRAKNIDPHDQFRISGLMNAFLKVVFNMERIISRVFSLPSGTSLIAIATKIS